MFTVSPRGMGLDCYRNWEILYMGGWVGGVGWGGGARGSCAGRRQTLAACGRWAPCPAICPQRPPAPTPTTSLLPPPLLLLLSATCRQPSTLLETRPPAAPSPAGGFPLVVRSSIDELFTGLPVWIVDR